MIGSVVASHLLNEQTGDHCKDGYGQTLVTQCPIPIVITVVIPPFLEFLTAIDEERVCIRVLGVMQRERAMSRLECQAQSRALIHLGRNLGRQQGIGLISISVIKDHSDTDALGNIGGGGGHLLRQRARQEWRDDKDFAPSSLAPRGPKSVLVTSNLLRVAFCVDG